MKERVENDQYYTKPEVAKACIDMMNFSDFDCVVEPSAGRGDFYRLLPEEKRVGFDIDPKHQEIIKANFFDLDLKGYGKTLTVGNPPFGKNSSLAFAFFQKAAEFSDCIALILPRTFRKPSMINRLNKSFHLEKEVLLQENSFYIDIDNKREDHSVPCLFQIWAKKSQDRDAIAQELKHPDFSFLEKTTDYEYSEATVKFSVSDYFNHEDAFTCEVSMEEYGVIKNIRKKFPKLFRSHATKKIERKVNWITKPDFVFRRAGAGAGKISLNYNEASMEGNEFIKAHTDEVIKVFQKMWEDLWSPNADPERKGSKYDTVGTPSLSKADLVREYKKYKKMLYI